MKMCLGLGDKSSAISGFERRVVNFTLRPSLTTCPLEGGRAHSEPGGHGDAREGK